MEYEHWVEEQNRQILELNSALSAHKSDIQIEELVNGMMNHYFKLFCMKSDAAKVDVFYVITGMWKTTSEQFFLWIGGFRPSELLKVMPNKHTQSTCFFTFLISVIIFLLWHNVYRRFWSL
jgi:transcription factor TGA